MAELHPLREHSLQLKIEHPCLVAAEKVVARLQTAGFEAYFVGGCVRDMIMGRDIHDADVVTNAKPHRVQELFPGSLAVGEHFGVIMVRLDGVHVEVATFRKESHYTDGRHPDVVTFGSLQDDFCRRDFTVNALYWNPQTHTVLDFAGGYDHIQSKTLRALGEPAARFGEDSLRLLRAVRFSVTLGFEIEASTLEALRNCAHQITRISAERIRDELLKGLISGKPSTFVQLLDDVHLLQILLPEVKALQGCAQPPKFHPEGDVFIHTMIALDNLPTDASETLVLATLFHDIGKPPTQVFADRIRFPNHAGIGAQMAVEIGRRLRMPTAIIEAIEHMVTRHMDFINFPKMRPATQQRFCASEFFEEELILHRSDCLASNGRLTTYEMARETYESLPLVEERRQLPTQFVNGDDLISMGMKPSPKMGEVLRWLHDQQIEGKLVNREQALEVARVRLNNSEI